MIPAEAGEKEVVMPIWELDPLDPSDSNWMCSKYCGRAIVRAENKVRARGLASDVFAKWPPLVDQKISIDPWLSEYLTSCQLLETSENDQDGPECLLEPDPAKYAPHLRSRPGKRKP